ncbi:uncharacterized protein LOC141664462 [Apium graveolens]|uniref:uncharacterized protein LOC141664462 n=1 Tax=Apium graveolens TaxID=4045 RepID=UPI003D78EE39
MIFDDFDLEAVKFPHNDSLVMTPIIGNSPVKRVLVDMEHRWTPYSMILSYGWESRKDTQMLNFVVVKAGSTYNAIMGRTGIHAFKAVPSSYHSVIKFPTRDAIGEDRGDQKMDRSCYVASLSSDGVGGQVLPIKDLDIHTNEEK